MNCLACGQAALHETLDLGRQPLANNLLDQHDEQPQTYELRLNYCAHCGHAQLSFFVPPEQLFAHYLYASGTSQTLQDYFHWFAQACTQLKPRGARVLELASNDGSLLKQLRDAGFTVLGVDPAQNLVGLAHQQGLETLCDFWPTTQLAASQTFDLIIGQNVLAHNPDPLRFLQAAERYLKDDGLCLIQTSQAHMLARGEFDTIYHEHYSFFSVLSMAKLAQRAGLVLRVVRLIAIHGDSFLFILSKSEQLALPAPLFDTAPFFLGSPALPDLTATTDHAAVFRAFGQRAHERMTQVRALVDKHRAQGRLICFVGAAAKAIVFMNAAQIQPDAIFDEALLKIGKFIPGFATPIRSLQEIKTLTQPCLFVLSAWNFRLEMAAKIRALLTTQDALFLHYFPQIEIY